MKIIKIIIYTLIIIPILLACSNESSSDSKNPSIEKISNKSGNYSIENFQQLGFKINKEYDVSELEDSLGVWFGFWKNNLNKPVDYEIRIYPDQKIAIDKGVIFVEEVIGENAILKKSTSSWKEGIQDRRARNNSSMSGSEANSVRAKYDHYIIVGNAIILCSGLDLTYAKQNCSDIGNSLLNDFE
mgnify:CR=1 FL=1